MHNLAIRPRAEGGNELRARNILPNMLTREAPLDGAQVRELAIRANSYDPASRTFEAVLSTGAGVRRRDAMGATFEERLDPSQRGMDASRLVGSPFVDNHDTSSVRSVLGVVVSYRYEGELPIVKIRVHDDAAAEAVARKIADGILRQISVGYTVKPEDWAESTENGVRVMTAKRWTPHEVSAVAVAADPGAVIRSLPAVDAQQIRTLASLAGCDAAMAEDLIRRNLPIDAARLAIADAVRQRAVVPMFAHGITVGQSYDTTQHYRRAMSEALYADVTPGYKPQDFARAYLGWSFEDHAKEHMRRAGESTLGLRGIGLLQRAMMTTSDFPLALGDTANRVARAAHQAAVPGIKRVARQVTHRDYRGKDSIGIGGWPTLQKVNEKGEYKRGSLAEERALYVLDRFGLVVAMTWKVIVNDDKGFFNDLPRKAGIAAAEKEGQILVQVLELNSGAGPTMGDTVALFHANHGNLAGAGAVIGEATVSAARLAMRKQTGIGGEKITIVPAYLVVPPDLETAAEKFLASIAAAKSSDVNPFAEKLGLVVDNRLSSATRWYITADPAQADGLELATLEGEPGPQVETRAGFDVDGIEIKVRNDIGAGFVDWRGWYMNPGA